MPTPSYTVVAINYRSREKLAGLLANIPSDIPAVIVDNSPQSDPVGDLAESRDSAKYVPMSANVGFAAAANAGAAACDTEVFVLLNPDCRPTSQVLDELVQEVLAAPETAACGPALIDEAGAVQLGGGGWLPTVRRSVIHAFGGHLLTRATGIWVKPNGGASLDLEWLAGTCLAVKRSSFMAVGGFDETFFLYGEDMSLGAKFLRRGLRQVMRADLFVPHLDGRSSDVGHAWLHRQRGRALGEYLSGHNPGLQAMLMRLLLIAGYSGRALLYTLLRKPARAKEVACYSQGLLGWHRADIPAA